jgi:hypothetical protein
MGSCHWPFIVLQYYSYCHFAIPDCRHKYDPNQTSRCRNIFTLFVILPWDKPKWQQEHNRHVLADLNASPFHHSQSLHFTLRAVVRDCQESRRQGRSDRWNRRAVPMWSADLFRESFQETGWRLFLCKTSQIIMIHTWNGRDTWKFCEELPHTYLTKIRQNKNKKRNTHTHTHSLSLSLSLSLSSALERSCGGPASQ